VTNEHGLLNKNKTVSNLSFWKKLRTNAQKNNPSNGNNSKVFALSYKIFLLLFFVFQFSSDTMGNLYHMHAEHCMGICTPSADTR
jgi:hypothetical protein